METELNVDVKKIDFSQHVLERYAERTMDKNNKQEINLYINSNIVLIKERLNKMYQYSELFYQGNLKDKSFANFYLNKDGWVMITDKEDKKMITLYKIDLHAGEELNKSFVEIMLNNINVCKEDLKVLVMHREEENRTLRVKVSLNESRIKDYERIIKGLKDENESTMGYIKSNQNNVSVKEQELKEHIEHLVSWKVF